MLVSCQHRTPARERNNSAGFSILCFRFRPIPNFFCENFVSEHVVVKKIIDTETMVEFVKKIERKQKRITNSWFVYRSVPVRSDAKEGDT